MYKLGFIALSAFALVSFMRWQTHGNVFQTSNAKRDIALTFDDGPHVTKTSKILKELEKQDIPATFFFVGTMAERYPAIVKEVTSSRHEIGNHTYSHQSLMLKSPADVTEEFRRTDLILGSVGDELFTRVPFLKPPLLLFAWNWVNRIPNRRFVGADVRPKDWIISDPRQVAKLIVDAVKPGSIILLHDWTDSAADSIAYFVPELKAKGYRFRTVTELFDEK